MFHPGSRNNHQNDHRNGSIPELRETASFPCIINTSIEALEESNSVPHKQLLSKAYKKVSKSLKRYKPRPVLEVTESNFYIIVL